MIDPELVTRKIVLITGDLDALGPLAAKPLDEYLTSQIDEVLAERYLERIIGRMIDINYHLLTESGLPPPRDYYAAFTELAKLGVLTPEFASRIAGCAGLRNRIAHEYDDIDPTKVHDALPAVVVDVPEYLRRINAFIVQGGPPEH